MKIVNAIIENVELEIEDHDILTCMLFLDFGGSIQGFGGYALGNSNCLQNKKNYCGHFIRRCLEVSGVNNWNKLKGKTVRVRFLEGTYNEKINAIGHIVKEDWFCPEEDFMEK
jgi:hypothetical protein